MKKCFAYMRVSGDSQIAGDGFPRQQKAIRDYAARNGFRIAKFYRDEGVTGTKETMDRPAWSEMMTALLADGVKTVVIEKLDRLSRQYFVQEAAIRELNRNGFRLVSTCEPDLMSSDPHRIAIRQMMGVFAELDKAQIVVRLRAARQRKRAANGRCEGRKPYGSRPGEQKVIERMRRLRAKGCGYQVIAEQLNEASIPPRSGARWYPYTVSKILQRPADKQHGTLIAQL
jgi:DNA invertase Pin-like site-specific DNA recombinase